MRKLATHRGDAESKHVSFPADTVVAEQTLSEVVVLDDERLTAACVVSPHLADPGQARDFQKQVIEDATEAGV
jgi:hypothetical protein